VSLEWLRKTNRCNLGDGKSFGTGEVRTACRCLQALTFAS